MIDPRDVAILFLLLWLAYDTFKGVVPISIRWSWGDPKPEPETPREPVMPSLADERVNWMRDIIERETIKRQGEGIFLVTGASDSLAFARAIVAAEPEVGAEMDRLLRALWQEAQNSSKAQEMMARAKTMRQADRDDYPELETRGYGWPAPEQTTAGRAYDALFKLVHFTPLEGTAA